MKVIAIGDIHGRNIWKKIDFNSYDAVVFVGDYLDSRQNLTDKVILKNLRDIIKLQSKYNHIHFLIGNHDLQYTDDQFQFFVSGYRESYAEAAMKTLSKLNWKFAVEIDNVLYSHAGVVREFYESIPNQSETYADTINEYGFENPELYLTCVSRHRGGHAPAGSPVWCDYDELVEEENPLPIHQVFGHTATKGSRIVFKGIYYRQCIDVLNRHPIAYEILDGGTPLPILLQ